MNSSPPFTDAVYGQVRDRLRHENELRRALAEEQLVLHYQPKWQVGSGELSGLEALIRWQHPERGLQLPVDFVPTAERVGLIETIGSWVLGTACGQLAGWRAMGLDGIRVAVNLAAAQFRDPELAAKISAMLEGLGLATSGLELEVTRCPAV